MLLRSAVCALALLGSSRAAEIDLAGCLLKSTGGTKVESACPLEVEGQDVGASMAMTAQEVQGEVLLNAQQQTLDLKFQSSGYSINVEKNGCCNGHTPRWVIAIDDVSGTIGSAAGQSVRISGNTERKMAIRNKRTGTEFPIVGFNHIYANLIYFWVHPRPLFLIILLFSGSGPNLLPS